MPGKAANAKFLVCLTLCSGVGLVEDGWSTSRGWPSVDTLQSIDEIVGPITNGTTTWFAFRRAFQTGDAKDVIIDQRGI